MEIIASLFQKLALAKEDNDGKVFDCFFSHNWGDNGVNHRYVLKIHEAMKKRGVKGWIDHNQMRGNINQAMYDGLESSNVFLAFLTKDYHDKVTGQNARDSCYREFKYAVDYFTHKRAIPIILDERMRNSRTWRNTLTAEIATAG